MVLVWDTEMQDFRYDDMAQYYRTNNLEPTYHDQPILARQSSRYKALLRILYICIKNLLKNTA